VLVFSERVESVWSEVAPLFEATSSQERRTDLLLIEAAEVEDALSELQANLDNFDGSPDWYTAPHIHELLEKAKAKVAQAKEELRRASGLGATQRSVARGSELIGEAVDARIGMIQVLNTYPALYTGERNVDTCPPQLSRGSAGAP
jgi:hypothetical protein